MAALTWMGVGLGRSLPVPVLLFVVAPLLAALVRPAARWWVIILTIGMAAGAGSSQREANVLNAPTPEGEAIIQARVVSGPHGSDGRHRYVARPRSLGDKEWSGPPIALVLPEGPTLPDVGDIVSVTGEIDPSPAFVRGRAVAATMFAGEFSRLSRSVNPFVRAGNAVRHRVQKLTAADGEGAALVAGFLIGDTSGVGEADIEAMRRAGLAHFVAVSGSNVALFLLGWWLVTMPVSLRSRPRAWLGLAALGVFVVATRWEPSVVRASGMAALVLMGRLVSWPIDRWMALGITVTVALLISPELAGSIGFQLSVAATAGVMSAPRTGRRPRWLWSSLWATLGAQIAVAPLLLQLGRVPLLAPLANLIAAPMVSMATVLGMAGSFLNSAMLVSVAARLADAVLDLAWWMFGGPQASWVGMVGVLVGLAAVRSSRTRPFAISIGVLGVVVGIAPSSAPPAPLVVFMDVGQGDAALLMGPYGEVILIDGGPDPTGVLVKLQEWGVDHVDLMVASHLHADHVTGLLAPAEKMPVGVLWHAGHREREGRYQELLTESASWGVSTLVPRHGSMHTFGSFHIEVLGPLRRYVSPNDQSLVLRIKVGDHRLLFPGDVEHIAQSELGALPAEILKVPHQGAATSDLDWLASVGAEVAIISVGPNNYGHPAGDVVAALTESGAEVLRTDELGDIAVEFRGGATRWSVADCVGACQGFD